MNREEERAEKRSRVLGLLEREGLDALVLARPGNVAWFLGGGRFHVAATLELGVAQLVVTREGEVLQTTNIEAGRLEAEELEGIQVAVRAPGWWEPEAAELPRGERVGADGPLPGCRDVEEEVGAVRASLTSAEIERYRAVCRETAAALTRTAQALAPGLTEHEAAGTLAGELEAVGLEAHVLLVAGAERVGRWRHPLPTHAPLGSLAMLVCCARRHGLVCSATRLVAFAPLGGAEGERYERLLAVDATLNGATRVGRAVGEVLGEGIAAYAEQGFREDAWQPHHQGGPTGYELRDYLATPSSPRRVVPGQAFAWNPSVPGLKVEDTILVGPAGPEVLSDDGEWPRQDVRGLARPLILERS